MSQEIETTETGLPPVGLVGQLARAEIDQQISTAHAYPRSMSRVKKAIRAMVELDSESAEECIYALPRGGKPIKGPSIRFAECLKQAFGNCRAAARVVNVDKREGYIEAEGIFHDLETNTATTARVRRRISGRNGQIFNDDMIIVTGNAACSIAMRNAILSGIPKPLWRDAYQQAEQVIAGTIVTLAVNRDKAFKALAAFGATPEQIYRALGIAGADDMATDHIITLRGMYSALKSGEANFEEMFAQQKPVMPSQVSGSQKQAAQKADSPKGAAPAEEQNAASAPHSDAAGLPLSPSGGSLKAAPVATGAPAGEVDGATSPAPSGALEALKQALSGAVADIGDMGELAAEIDRVSGNYLPAIKASAEKNEAKSLIEYTRRYAAGEIEPGQLQRLLS